MENQRISAYKRLKSRIKTHIGFIKRPVRLYHMTIDGKKLLIVAKFNLRGVEWIRRYEVVDEVDEHRNRMGREFPVPKPPSSSAFRRNADKPEEHCQSQK